MTDKKNRPLGSRKSTPRSRITVRGSGRGAQKAPLAKAGKIPPGAYRATISSIKSVKTAAGEDAVEIIYDLAAPDGRRCQMREVIPVDSWPFECFCDAMIAAGLNENDDLTDAVGICEDVELHYPDARGFGRFKHRVPAAASVGPSSKDSSATESDDEGEPLEADEDEEFDDFLEEEDDED